MARIARLEFTVCSAFLAQYSFGALSSPLRRAAASRGHAMQVKAICDQRVSSLSAGPVSDVDYGQLFTGTVNAA
jgi:hypothetical protein